MQNEFFNIKSNNEAVVCEPLRNIVKLIDDETDKSKIILAGSRNSGKTLAAHYYIDCLKDNNEMIYSFISEKIPFDKALNANVLEHFIEINICRILYNFIKKINYGLFDTYFAMASQEIDAKSKETLIYIDRGIGQLTEYHFGDMVAPLIMKIRKIYGIESLGLILDKLDNFDNSIQSIFKNYLTLFDKVMIITSDKRIYGNPPKLSKLREAGYNVINVNYTKDNEIAKEIVNRRIMAENQKRDCSFYLDNIEEFINKDILDKALKIINGDMQILLYAVARVYEKVMLYGYKPLSRETDCSFMRDVQSVLLLHNNEPNREHTKRLFL